MADGCLFTANANVSVSLQAPSCVKQPAGSWLVCAEIFFVRAVFINGCYDCVLIVDMYMYMYYIYYMQC